MKKSEESQENTHKKGNLMEKLIESQENTPRKETWRKSLQNHEKIHTRAKLQLFFFHEVERIMCAVFSDTR